MSRLLLVRTMLVAAMCLALPAGAALLGAQVEHDLIDNLPPAVKKANRFERPEPRNVTVMRTLRSKAEFKVEIMPLADFAKFLSERFKTPFKLDSAGLERAGVRPEAPVSAEIANMPLSAALQQILGRLNLAHRVVDGAVLITNRQPARELGGRVILHNGEVVMIQKGLQGNNVQIRKDQAARLMRPLLQIELIFVKRICAPSKVQMREIREDMEKLVEGATDQVFNLVQGRTTRPGGGFCATRKFVEEKLAALVEQRLSPEKAALYRAELGKRDVSERDACLLSLVASLDRELCLSTGQRNAVRAALSSKWDEAWIQNIEMAAIQGQPYIPAIPDEMVEPHLDAAQIAIWEGMQKIGNVNWGFQALQSGWFGMPAALPDDE